MPNSYWGSNPPGAWGPAGKKAFEFLEKGELKKNTEC
jgi:hypothetical protein